MIKSIVVALVPAGDAVASHPSPAGQDGVGADAAHKRDPEPYHRS